jgi:gluconate:H+ symporter, GntP family
MEVTVSVWGALIALVVSISLILKKVPPAYGMMAGALIGGIVGGVALTDTVNLMISGGHSVMPAVLRILSAGVLAGVLIESGGAKTISETLIKTLGEKNALFAVTLTTLILTSVGVFIDVAVITVSPIAITIASRAKISRFAILLAMIGGGKSGNIISANPSTIVAAEAFEVPLTTLMVAGIIPAIVGVIVTCTLAIRFKNKGPMVQEIQIKNEDLEELPSFASAIVAPLVAITLLAMRPLFGINIDPMIALPVGGIVGGIAMGRFKNLNTYATSGLSRMSGVAIMLIGTGTLAGIIANSDLSTVIVNTLQAVNVPGFLLAPISGALMSLATASTTAGVNVAAGVFGAEILDMGVQPLAAAAMLYAGATVFDHMPHGSFFHATGGSVNMDIKERLKLMPYESLIGFSLALTSTILFGIILA